jgi:hypothetical protein
MKTMSLLQYRLLDEEKTLQNEYFCKLFIENEYKMKIECKYSIHIKVEFYIPQSYPISMPKIIIQMNQHNYEKDIEKWCRNMEFNQDIERNIESFLVNEIKEYSLHQYIHFLLHETKNNQKIIEWYHSYQKYFKQGYTHRVSIQNIMKRIKELLDIYYL